MSASSLVRMQNRECDKSLKKLERVKGIEPSYSAWKSDASSNVFISRSDNLQLFAPLRQLQNFALSE
jgi:hypothetical protein